MLRGKIRGNTPVCPAASTPNPNNCSRFPIPKTPIFKKRGCSSEFELHPQREMTPIPNNYSGYPRRSRSCNPESRWYNNPNNLSVYPRSPSWRSRSPIPNPEYPEHFPLAGGSPTPPNNPAIPLGFRYPLLLGFVRLLWEFLLV